MTGPEVKKVLMQEKLHLKDIAEMLGLTQPNFTQLLQVKDVKTGLLERLCDVLNKKLDFFYKDSPYFPTLEANIQSIPDCTSKDKEIEFLKGKVNALEEMNEKLMKMVSTMSSINIAE